MCRRLGGTERAQWEHGIIIFSMEKEMRTITLEQDSLYTTEYYQQLREYSFFFSDKVSYIVLRGRWCNIIVLNVHAPSEEKSGDSTDRFYEELEQVFWSFS